MSTVSAVTLADGLTLSYAAQGEPPGPALVLLPGPTDSWVSYQPVLERLPHTIRVVAVSQRGHGDSEWIADGSYRFRGKAKNASYYVKAPEDNRGDLICATDKSSNVKVG